MFNWLKRGWRAYREAESINGLLEWGVTKAIIQFIAPAAVLIAGQFEAIPFTYALTAACVAFGSVAVGLLRYDEWKERTDPSGKVVFAGPLLDFTSEKRDGEDYIASGRLGFLLRNLCNYPVNFTVETVETVLDSRVSMEQLDVTVVEIPTQGEGFCRDNPIQLDIPIPTEGMVGRINFRAKYWVNPNKKYDLEKRINIRIGFDGLAYKFEFTES